MPRDTGLCSFLTSDVFITDYYIIFPVLRFKGTTLLEKANFGKIIEYCLGMEAYDPKLFLRWEYWNPPKRGSKTEILLFYFTIHHNF